VTTLGSGPSGERETSPPGSLSVLETPEPADRPIDELPAIEGDIIIEETQDGPVETVPARPTMVERALVVVTVFVLIHGLPMDWLRTREGFLDQDGNLKMVAAQLALMALGIARVAGWFNWVIRALKLDLTLIGLAMLALLSTLWSADPFETMKQAIILLVVTCYGTYLVLRFTLPEALELIARVYAISGVVNLAFIFALPQYGLDADGLWDGVFFQKNALGFSSLLAVPILLVVGRSGPSWRHLYYLCLPIQVTLLIGSQSKTMLVATIGSCLLLVVYRMFRGRTTLRGAAIVALSVISLTTVAIATANIELLADWLDKDITLTGRIPLWQGLIPIAQGQPFLGYGYKATFGGYFSPVHEVWVSEGWEPQHAHNAILQTWLELGMVGVALVLFGFARATGRALTAVASTSGTVMLWPLVYISSVLLISITESGIIHSQTGWMLFVVAALSVALRTRQLAFQRTLFNPAGRLSNDPVEA